MQDEARSHTVLRPQRGQSHDTPMVLCSSSRNATGLVRSFSRGTPVRRIGGIPDTRIEGHTTQ